MAIKENLYVITEEEFEMIGDFIEENAGTYVASDVISFIKERRVGADDSVL